MYKTARGIITEIKPVFVSDVLSDVIGVISKYSAEGAILPTLSSTCVFSKADYLICFL